MKRYFLPLLLVLLASCHKTTPDNDTQVKDPTTYYANLFAFNLMYTYYLWADEETDAIKSWSYGDNPIEKVASLRYKDANGNLVDRWTELMEDCSSFENSITGNGKTFGMEFLLLIKILLVSLLLNLLFLLFLKFNIWSNINLLSVVFF